MRPSRWLAALLALLLHAFACAPSIDPPRASAAPSGPAPRLIVEPDAGAGALLDLVSAAQRAVWMEMYLLTDDGAIDALSGRAQAGCDVRVILEPHPYQADGANQGAYERLAAAGADVRWSSPAFAFTHAKAIVIDHARLLVLTLNLTRAGLGGNREYALIDEAPADVAAAEAVIAADLTGGAAAIAGRLLASPGGTRPALAALIAGAALRLDVEMEELSDPDLAQALADAAARGVAVSVALPASARSAATTAAARRLGDAGAVVSALGSPDVHAKAVVADGRRVYVGSANLTTGSLDANREVGLLVDDTAVAGAVAGVIESDVAGGEAL
jgi:phosphatidylserine/phosphatidylglycerophosphate/cardiolipin synthase-like enzyme